MMAHVFLYEDCMCNVCDDCSGPVGISVQSVQWLDGPFTENRVDQPLDNTANGQPSAHRAGNSNGRSQCREGSRGGLGIGVRGEDGGLGVGVEVPSRAPGVVPLCKIQMSEWMSR